MKSKFAAVLLVLVLLVPSAIAAVSYFNTKSAPLSEAVIDTISISDLNGRTYTLKNNDADAAASSMFDALLEANKNAVKVAGGLPAPLVGTKFFAISFYGLEKTLNCQYYFKADSTDAYYLDNDAYTYQLPASFVTVFQNSTYALSLYETATPPVLTLGGKFQLTPSAMSWKYKLADGTFASSAGVVTGENADNFFIDGGLDIAFSRQPDVLDVQVYNGSALVFDDDYTKIGTLSFTEKTAVTIELSASWYQDSAREYFGDATYRFSAEIAAPPKFAINQTEIDPGDLVAVSVSGVTDVSRLTFASEPAINYTPTFYLDGEIARALVPVSYELAPGAYKFTVGYGAATGTLDLTVREKTFKTSVSTISAAVEAATRTEESIKAFEDTVRDIALTGDAKISFSGKFYDYTVDATGYSIMTGVGVTKKISDTGTSYRHNGVDFKVSTGTDVGAVMAGTVVYVGETTLSGKLVIIEHGLGLKSWYAHLGSASVAVGDVVTTGQVIAKTGDTGFTNGTTLHLGLTVFDVPVSIYPLWEGDGLVIKDPA